MVLFHMAIFIFPFVDFFRTGNVLVYAASPRSPFHAPALGALVRHRAAGRQLWISTQIIREFLVVMCNPKLTTPALLPEQTALAVRYLLRRFCVAEDTTEVSRALSRLLTLLPPGARRIHDEIGRAHV